MITNIDKAIKFFGTQEGLAKKCNVSQAAVQKWASGKCRPSALSSKNIERATGGAVKAADLRPDIFN